MRHTGEKKTRNEWIWWWLKLLVNKYRLATLRKYFSIVHLLQQPYGFEPWINTRLHLSPLIRYILHQLLYFFRSIHILDLKFNVFKWNVSWWAHEMLFFHIFAHSKCLTIHTCGGWSETTVQNVFDIFIPLFHATLSIWYQNVPNWGIFFLSRYFHIIGFPNYENRISGSVAIIFSKPHVRWWS